MIQSRINRQLMQDVIDAVLAHGEQYEKALKELNEKFKVKYELKHNHIRTYAKN